MSRRIGTYGRSRRPRSILGFWTLPRASGVGVIAGLAALLIDGLFGTWGRMLYPYAVLLILCAACGASILWITATDMRSRGTSGRMRPIRGFDIALGLALLVASFYALTQIWPRLEL